MLITKIRLILCDPSAPHSIQGSIPLRYERCEKCKDVNDDEENTRSRLEWRAPVPVSNNNLLQPWLYAKNVVMKICF